MIISGLRRISRRTALDEPHYDVATRVAMDQAHRIPFGPSGGVLGPFHAGNMAFMPGIPQDRVPWLKVRWWLT